MSQTASQPQPSSPGVDALTAHDLTAIIDLAHSQASGGLRRDPPDDRYTPLGQRTLQKFAEKFAPPLSRYHARGDHGKLLKTVAALTCHGTTVTFYWDDQREALADAAAPILLLFGFVRRDRAAGDVVAAQVRAVLYSPVTPEEKTKRVERLLGAAYTAPRGR